MTWARTERIVSYLLRANEAWEFDEPAFAGCPDCLAREVLVERLREALLKITVLGGGGAPAVMRDVARQALEDASAKD